jgi:hypothetical protein
MTNNTEQNILKEKIDYTKIEYTREWFQNPDNQAHTIQDVELFYKEGMNIIENLINIGDNFLLDLIPIDGDVEIWEVTNTKGKYYCKERHQWFNFIPIRKITTGKQFGYPNGYWKVKTQ